MSDFLSYTDPEAPEYGSYRIPPAGVPNLDVPPSYFKESTDRILSVIRLASMDAGQPFSVDDDYFEQSAQQIISIARLKNLERDKNIFTAPAGYFDSASEKKKVIVHPSSHQRGLLLTIAVAASIAAVIYFLLPDQETPPTFAQLLQESNLVENDIEPWIELDDIEEFFADEITRPVFDTITPGTTHTEKTFLSDSLLNQQAQMDSIPVKQQPAVNPNEKKVSFDDLTEEEIIQYLLESGDDIFEDL